MSALGHDDDPTRRPTNVHHIAAIRGGKISTARGREGAGTKTTCTAAGGPDDRPIDDDDDGDDEECGENEDEDGYEDDDNDGHEV